MTNPFVGNWTYRSFLNDPDLSKAANDLLFGEGTLAIAEVSVTELSGTIGGPGWSLDLRGSFGYGSPMQVRFQGKGVIEPEPRARIMGECGQAGAPGQNRCPHPRRSAAQRSADHRFRQSGDLDLGLR